MLQRGCATAPLVAAVLLSLLAPAACGPPPVTTVGCPAATGVTGCASCKDGKCLTCAAGYKFDSGTNGCDAVSHWQWLRQRDGELAARQGAGTPDTHPPT